MSHLRRFVFLLFVTTTFCKKNKNCDCAQDVTALNASVRTVQNTVHNLPSYLYKVDKLERWVANYENEQMERPYVRRFIDLLEDYHYYQTLAQLTDTLHSFKRRIDLIEKVIGIDEPKPGSKKEKRQSKKSILGDEPPMLKKLGVFAERLNRVEHEVTNLTRNIINYSKIISTKQEPVRVGSQDGKNNLQEKVFDSLNKYETVFGIQNKRIANTENAIRYVAGVAAMGGMAQHTYHLSDFEEMSENQNMINDSPVEHPIRNGIHLRQTFYKFFLDAYDKLVALQAPEIANIFEDDIQHVKKQRGNLLELARAKLKTSKQFPLNL